MYPSMALMYRTLRSTTPPLQSLLPIPITPTPSILFPHPILQLLMLVFTAGAASTSGGAQPFWFHLLNFVIW